ncbi:helix-turn-helix domain-containing protein [Intrasporangium sp. DVR]|uniref:IclR family transcriptional regulator n=1 Tax=Intrasporangium sp. DVR TaxID=3127867 RepID=UPI00313A7269
MTRPPSPTVTVTAGAEIGPGAPASQTLDRGLRALELVAAAAEPMTTADVAVALGLHRSITYRMLRTLEDRRLVDRDGGGGWLPGVGLAVLATNVVPEIRSAAQPILESLADATAMTSFLVIRDHDEAVTVSVVEPRSAVAHVTYRPGKRHPVHRGAPGIALLAGAGSGERPEVGACRRRGWAYSESEVLPGMKSVASPVVDDDGACRAAVAVVFVGDHDLAALGRRVAEAATDVARRAWSAPQGRTRPYITSSE